MSGHWCRAMLTASLPHSPWAITSNSGEASTISTTAFPEQCGIINHGHTYVHAGTFLDYPNKQKEADSKTKNAGRTYHGASDGR
jgi:hypothetical protein